MRRAPWGDIISHLITHEEQLYCTKHASLPEAVTRRTPVVHSQLVCHKGPSLSPIRRLRYSERQGKMRGWNEGRTIFLRLKNGRVSVDIEVRYCTAKIKIAKFLWNKLFHVFAKYYPRENFSVYSTVPDCNVGQAVHVNSTYRAGWLYQIVNSWEPWPLWRSRINKQVLCISCTHMYTAKNG